VQRNFERTMDEIASAARSIRLLADYLHRHPEGVVRGRTEEAP
jgi:paraquat-inducible protein B